MRSTGLELDDFTLINFLINSYPDINFLSKDTVKNYIFKIKEIKEIDPEKLKKDGFKTIFDASRTKNVNVLDFWESLQIDAIKYLKWHDPDEFPINLSEIEEDNIHLSNKEAIYDNISRTSLGVYNLKEYFKAFVEFEGILYGAEQFYRDHVYHIIRVWLIGQLLIKQYINEDFLIEIPEDRACLVEDALLPRSVKNKNTL